MVSNTSLFVSSNGNRNKERYDLVFSTDSEKEQELQKHTIVTANVPPNLVRVELKLYKMSSEEENLLHKYLMILF